MLDDMELLESWATGDERAGRELFDRYFEPLYRFFCNKIDDGVEDMVQETFLACFEARSRFRGDASFRTFLFAVARKRLYKRWYRAERDGRHIDFGVTSVAELGLSPSGVAAQQQEHERLMTALRRIPADLQVALELFYWEDMSAPEIAAVLEVPEGTARSRLRRARELLLREIRRLDRRRIARDVGPGDLEAWARSIRALLRSSMSSDRQRQAGHSTG